MLGNPPDIIPYVIIARHMAHSGQMLDKADKKTNDKTQWDDNVMS